MPTADKLYKINRAKTELDFHQTSSPIQPTLYPHQQDTVDRAPDKRLLAYDTGAGKTITSISLVNKKGANDVLVIAPKTNVEQWGIELSKYIDKNVVCKVLSKEEFKKQVKTLPSYQAVIVDECFAAGTKIKTENGYKNIERVVRGDRVYNAFGLGTVDKAKSKLVNEIYIIKLSNGKEVKVTGNHKFFTSFGWKETKYIQPNDELLHYFGVNDIIKEKKYEMQSLPSRNNEFIKGKSKNDLFSELSVEIEMGGTWRKNEKGISEFIYNTSRQGKKDFREDEEKQSNVYKNKQIKNATDIKTNWSQTENSWWKWASNANTPKNIIGGTWRWLVRRTYSFNKKNNEFTIQLQNRYSIPKKDDSNRGRWKFTWFKNKTTSRFKKRKSIKTIRVESITIQKRKNIRVYNLSVTGHPSYYVEDILVHNCHYFAGIKSGLSKALYWYLNNKLSNVKYSYLCTATPYCSTPMNIYTLAKHLGYSWNYEAFKNKFFYYIPMGSRAVPQLRKGMEDEVAKLVKEIGDTVDIKDVVEVPEQEESVIKIPLTKPQLDAIRDNFDPVFIVRWTKQHQIENGFLYEEGYPTKTFENNKTKEVLRLAKENEKIIFVARYTQQIELYETELKKLGYNVMTLTGSTKNRQEVIEAANTAPRCVLLIQASVSAGYELPTFRVMVFASLSFSYVDKKQAAGRILRINHLHENKYIYLVSEGVDQDVYDCIKNKHDFTLKIYEKNN